ncbi:peptidoglycan-binding domain-containing protein [Dactylosporangium sp. AC04546]|uniref:peptidoglycan-binding protein n=1 Tax=Dactylosporangium sp. AC04546 TaxID=2862460 RepID=UPI001EDE0EB2|nr:peptidoglycan-binding domain-containing protein [Dactylosporangium sp. AC04546]WVK83493.1 peptidoglycan-binding domain-containing protein [Dactylosporangium sp. AC04546]
MKRLWWLLALPVVFAGAIFYPRHADPAPAVKPSTTKITRGTLTVTEDVDGTLGFGTATTVVGRLPGMVTGLPGEGTTVQRGQQLYRVDGGPVLLWYGTAPLYRTLKPGDEGADVAMFEAGLAALGYKGFTADDSYTSATADAVRDWQESLGLPRTGTVEVGRIVVAPGAVRVGQVRAHLGDNATTAVLDWTGSARVVTVRLDVTKQELASVGDAARVRLPNDTVVDGTISAIGAVATASVQGNTTTVTVDVTVTLAAQDKLGTYDAAPVDVTLVSESRENVLTVPVAALVALAEGGYGLQIVNDAGGVRTVAVKTGLFAAGRVEVSGADLSEGLTVGVAA